MGDVPSTRDGVLARIGPGGPDDLVGAIRDLAAAIRGRGTGAGGNGLVLRDSGGRGRGTGVKLPLAVAGTERDRAPTIPEATAGWKSWLIAQRYSPDSQERYIDTVEEIAEDFEWESVLDASTSEIGGWLSRMTVENEWSGRTHNNRLSAIRTFFEWVKVNKWRGENPADSLACVTHIEGDGVREFELAQMCGIIAAAEGRRRAAYIVGATTGLRKSNICLRRKLEKNAMRWGWAHLDTKTLRFPGGTVKKKPKPFEIPLTDEAVAALRAIRPADAAPDRVVFPFWIDNRTLRSDMAKAGVPYLNEQGERASFSSFRKGYLTALANAGVHPKIAQELAGHSTMELTMKHYTKARMGEKRAAAENIFVLTNPGQIKGYENPGGSGSEKCVDTGVQMPSHIPVKPSALEHVHSPKAPCESGTLGGFTSSRGPRRGGPSGCDVPSFPGSASSMTPRGFEARGIGGDRTSLRGFVASTPSAPSKEADDDARYPDAAGSQNLPGVWPPVHGSAVGCGEGAGEDLLGRVPAEAQRPAIVAGAEACPRVHEGGAGAGAGAGELAGEAGSDGEAGRLPTVREDGQGGRAPRELRGAGQGRVALPLVSHEAALQAAASGVVTQEGSDASIDLGGRGPGRGGIPERSASPHAGAGPVHHPRAGAGPAPSPDADGAQGAAPGVAQALTTADRLALREKITDAHCRYLALMATLAVLAIAAVFTLARCTGPTPERERVAISEDWRLP